MVASLLLASTMAFVAASVAYVAWVLSHGEGTRRFGVTCAVLGVGLSGVVLANGFSGDAVLPLGDRVMLFVSLGVVGLWLAARSWRELPMLGVVVVPLVAMVVLCVTLRAYVPPVVSATAGGLGTVMVVHIGATVLGFLLFVPAYVLAVLFLGQEYRLKQKKDVGGGRMPSLMSLERMAWRLLYLGFPLYSLGIVLGVAWQDSLQTHGLQPQHIMASLGWLVLAYTIVRHLQSGWRGRAAALSLVVGFVVTFGAVLLYSMR